MSFVWLGIAVLILPTPGGKAPDWLKAIMSAAARPVVPFPIIAAIVIGVVVHSGLMHSSYGVIAARRRRQSQGARPRRLVDARAPRSSMFALAGFFGVLVRPGAARAHHLGDANVADRYTLYSIAGVILGGGEFVGGRVSPIGAVIGALTLALAGSFLIFLQDLARLADRRARRDPDHRAGAAGARHLRRSSSDERPCRRLADTALDLVLRRRRLPSGSSTIAFTGGQGAGEHPHRRACPSPPSPSSSASARCS